MEKFGLYLLFTLCCLSGVLTYDDYEKEISKMLTDPACVTNKNISPSLRTFLDQHEDCVEDGYDKVIDAFKKNQEWTLIEEICGDKNLVKLCLERSDSHLSPCLKSDKKSEPFAIASSSLAGGKEYLCKRDHENLKKLLKAKDCLHDKKSKIDKCQSEYKNIDDDWFFRSFREDKDCSLRGDWGKCVVKALDDCRDKAAKNIVEGTLREALSNSKCKKLMKSRYPMFYNSASTAKINTSLFSILCLVLPASYWYYYQAHSIF